MVVSTERPSRTAHSDAPAPRWQVIDPARRGRSPARRTARRRRPGVGQPVEPEAPQAPSLAPRRRQGVGAGRGGQGGVEGGVEAGDVRARSGRCARAAAMPASARGWCSGASGVSARMRSTTSAVDRRVAATRSGPPCTTRWPTASTAATPASTASMASAARPSSPSHGSTSGSPRTRVVGPDDQRQLQRADEPALTTRTRSARPGPVPGLGEVLAVVARVAAVLGAQVDHLLAHRRGVRCRGRAPGR